MTTSVRILADDLTGALDAAAPFAAAIQPVPVGWRPHAPRADGTFARDSESRDVAIDLDDELRLLARADIAFKKIDSLLRGTTLGELRACVRSGRFASVVVAPAFPAQNRITRGGRQLWRAATSDRWRPTDADLRDALAGLHESRVGVPADHVAGRGIFLCDAADDHDLDAIVAAGRRLEPPLLWIGTAGLARALAGPGRRPAPPLPPLLIVVGSHHPVTLAQVGKLAEARPDALLMVGLDDPAERVTARLASLRSGAAASLLHLSVPDGTGARKASPFFERVFEALRRTVAPPATMLVTGGSTLHRLATVFGAEGLLVEGEWRPGLPLSTLTGGAWDGTRVVSKSGGFGSADVLLDLLSDLEEPSA